MLLLPLVFGDISLRIISNGSLKKKIISSIVFFSNTSPFKKETFSIFSMDNISTPKILHLLFECFLTT